MSAGAAADEPPLSTTFSLACFPAERIAILAGMVAGPGIAAALLARLAQTSGRSDVSWLRALGESGANARLFAGLAVLLALGLIVYGALYLQWRAGTTLVVDNAGFRWRRAPVLPGGLLGAAVEQPWSAVTRVELVARRRLLAERALLTIAWAGGELRIPVADAWLVGAGQRPGVPRPPAGGWEEHPLPRAVRRAWQAARETNEKNPVVEGA